MRISDRDIIKADLSGANSPIWDLTGMAACEILGNLPPLHGCQAAAPGGWQLRRPESQVQVLWITNLISNAKQEMFRDQYWPFTERKRYPYPMAAAGRRSFRLCRCCLFLRLGRAF